jgi:hypothetical protein
MCHPIQLFSNKVADGDHHEHQMNAPKKFHPQKLQKRIPAPSHWSRHEARARDEPREEDDLVTMPVKEHLQAHIATA